MNQPIEKYKLKGKRELRIYQDEIPTDPREWDNLGIMVLNHKRYNLPLEIKIDLDSFNSWEEIRKELIKFYDASVILPVYGYDHSGLSIKAGKRTFPFNDRWDSGQLGFIFVTKKKIKEENITKKKAEEILLSEIEIYNKYLNGEIYCFEVVKFNQCKTCEHNKEEIEDSCGGFYEIKDILSEFKEEREKIKKC